MKLFYTILATILAETAVLMNAEEAVKPAPTMPDEVTLISGRVLKRVKIVRLEANRIVLKYAGGTEPIAFSLFQKPSPAEISAMLDYVWTFKGQAFVVTRGAGSYKLGNMSIFVFPGTKNQIDTKSQQAKSTKTDADGRFEFKWKGIEPFVIHAMEHRSAGGELEIYQWKVERNQIQDPANVILSNDNMD